MAYISQVKLSDTTYDISAIKLKNARTLTIGNTGKTFDGTANVSWSLKEIGAVPKVEGSTNGSYTVYRALGNIYKGSTAVTYYRIALPQATPWGMIMMKLAVRENYNNGSAGEIIIYANHSSNSEWNKFYATCIGKLSTNIKVYGSDKKYFYIAGNFAYGGLSVELMTVGDSAASINLGNVVLDTVTALPTTYQTATMYYSLHSGNYNDYAPTKTGSGASGTWPISITGKAATAGYTSELLGVNSSNTPYGYGEGNIIRAVWNVQSDNRWYLKANSYGVRVSYADMASKLATSRTISLTGSITGSGSFDGSGDLSISTTTNHNHDSLYPKKDGSGASGTWGINISGNASTATKLTNLTTADEASSTDTWRRVWFAYNDNATGRPAYSDIFAYQSSTGTVKATKFQGALSGNADTATKATQDGNGNVISSTYAKLRSTNDFVHSGNEWTVVPSGYSGSLWLNYRTCGGTNGGITQYIFGNGKGGSSDVTITAGTFQGALSGNAATATALTSSAGSSTQPVYFSGGKPVACTSLDLNTSGKAAGLSYYPIDDNLTVAQAKEQIRNKLTNKGIAAAVLSSSYINQWNTDTASYYGSSVHSIIALNPGYNNTTYGHFLVALYGDGNLCHIGVNRNNWGSLKTILDSSNYTDYTVTKTGSGASGTWGINITGSSTSCTGNAATATTAAKLGRSGDTAYPMTFNWSGQSGQPSWLWGGNDGTNMYVYNPSNFNVSYANSCGTSSNSNWLNTNSTLQYGASGLNYFNISGSANGAADTNGTPTADWYHIIRMNHANSNGYYFDIASCFHNNNMYFKRVASGTSSGWQHIWVQGNAVTGAVWNDYAECRESDCKDFGYVLMETGDDSLTKTTERLSHFAGVSSDTWGFSQGETEKAKTPIAVAGRVLVYPYQDRNNYKPGDCVCAAPGGTVDIMTREEVREWPDRIVGTVSCVPNYEEWGGGEGADRDPVKVNGRIWIKVK